MIFFYEVVGVISETTSDEGIYRNNFRPFYYGVPWTNRPLAVPFSFGTINYSTRAAASATVIAVISKINRG